MSLLVSRRIRTTLVSHLQERYLCGRVDVVVIRASEERVHEMLCRSLCIEFDNRMLQVKKQLRVVACGFSSQFSAAILEVY